ncbi:hypothetical protein EYZ11_013499 [Aspergillus tanneri]|uniref:Uncharacterized protein n=1 Tax=Aspergillus tanneri TaxID=1220188 RepID=A0A4S3IXI6_9EURO|nr:hypothetical protein EYZ11_013499 [Aspergillus tanneri]
MTLQGVQALPAAGIPHLNGLVEGGRGELLGVRREDYRVDRTIITLQGVQALPAAGIPHLDGLVAGGRGEPLGVRREDYRVDRTIMALEGLQASTPAFFKICYTNYPVWLLILIPCYAAPRAKD